MKRNYTRIIYKAVQYGKSKRIIADYAMTVSREDIWTDLELYGGCLEKNGRGYILTVNSDMIICYY